MRMTSRISLLFLAAAAVLLPQEPEKKFGWPLAIRDGVSSSFQEFRSSHFHAGIDMRTMQRTGFPVLAVADGVIERLTVSRRNYGRCLLLRHAGGYSSLYGHLEKFRTDLEAIVSAEQAGRGEKYFGDLLLPRPIAVRRGEVIAFSGETGAGFAHLHLEIRDGSDRAVNPLILIGDQSFDGNPPRIRGVLLRSRGGSLVNGDCGEFYFKLRQQGDAYTLAEPLRINGPCDISLDAFDLSDVGHVIAPIGLEASLDGRPVFREYFDRLSRDDNNQLGMLYDMAYSTPATYFFNICSQSGFALEGTGARLADELQRLAPGLHEIRISVTDQQQNRALAILPIFKVPAGEPRSFERKAAAAAAGNGLMQESEFSTFVNRGDLVVLARDFPAAASRLKLKVIQGGAEQVIPAREYAYGAFFCFQPLNHDPRLLLRFELSDSGLTVEARQKTLQVVWLKNDLAQTARLGDFAAEFGPTSVREPTVLLLEPVALQPEFPLLGVAIRSEPVHFAFLDAVHYKFRVPVGTERPAQLGIFKYRPALKKWSYVSTQPDREAGYLSCRVLTAGTFALLRDIFPPAISLRRPGSRSLGRLQNLVVRLSDKGKGIDDTSLEVFLNGRPVEAEYDPDWSRALLEELPFLRKGRNELLVRIADLAGNRSEKRFNFSLR
jgi:hypothetical protein